MGQGWIGVDLDGTLAEHKHLPDYKIGKPIPAMVERVKRWLAEGKEVRIVTARVARGWDPRADNWRATSQWTVDTFGQQLEVTAEKDPDMIELWDDRAVQVIRNTGVSVEERVQDIMDKFLFSDGHPSYVLKQEMEKHR